MNPSECKYCYKVTEFYINFEYLCKNHAKTLYPSKVKEMLAKIDINKEYLKKLPKVLKI